MSLIAKAAPVCLVCDFCLIFVPFGHYDEPEILSYTIKLICSIGVDVRQARLVDLRAGNLTSNLELVASDIPCLRQIFFTLKPAS
jgi:hypothetical protein